MVERVVKSTRSGWGVLALGAAVSTACAALLFLRRQRSVAREADAYEEWWRRRDHIRANGDQNPHLFV